MPYNPETQQTVVVSKHHRDLVRAIAVKHKRKLRAQLELLIEQSAKREGIEL